MSTQRESTLPFRLLAATSLLGMALASGCGAPPPISVDEPAQGAATPLGAAHKTTPTNVCDKSAYPCGPFGFLSGEVVANLQLYGRHDDNNNGTVTDDPARIIKMSDYYKDKSIKVIAVLVAAEWCGPCQQEQPDLVAAWKKYQTNKSGVAFIEAIIQRKDGTPADLDAVDRWSKQFKTPFDMVADPTVALGPYYNVAAFPMQMVIQTSDMTIQAQNNGYMRGWIENTVDSLLPAM